MKKFLFSLISVSLFSFAYAWEDVPCDCEEQFAICEPIDCCRYSLLDRFYLVPHAGYAVGRTIGIDQDYVNIGGLAILEKNGVYLFSQTDGYRIREENRWAYSAGGGVRVADCCNRLWGLNAFYDSRTSETGHFRQFGMGFEALSPTWCVSGNLYLPVQGPKDGPVTVFDDYVGGYVATVRLRESPMTGGNLEFAWYFPAYFCGFQPYFALGPYFLTAFDNFHPGVRFRSGLLFRDWLLAEVVVTHDEFFNTRVQGAFTLYIPLRIFTSKCAPCNCTCAPFLRPVQRFNIMPLDPCCSWTWNW